MSDVATIIWIIGLQFSIGYFVIDGLKQREGPMIILLVVCILPVTWPIFLGMRVAGKIG